MSVAFSAHLYGKAAIYYNPDGSLGSGAPTGPKLVRWMVGGLASLITVNGSNLATSPVTPYAFSYSSSVRFLPGNSLTQGFTPCLMLTGARRHVMPMNLIYPR